MMREKPDKKVAFRYRKNCMKIERVRFALQKLYRKRIEKYCVWTGQCEGFVHHHFRVTHPDWKKLWYEVHFAKKGYRRDSIEKIFVSY